MHWKQPDAIRGALPPQEDEQALHTQDVRNRQAAAAFLKAARATSDEAEQEFLRCKAAELLSPRVGTKPAIPKGEGKRPPARPTATGAESDPG